MAPEINSPYRKSGPSTSSMMLMVTGCLSLIALHFSLRYWPPFILLYMGYLAAGLLMEFVVVSLKEKKYTAPRASNTVTVALLVLSLPAAMPWYIVLGGISVSVIIAKILMRNMSIRLNPMLLGRLFIMLIAADAVQIWDLSTLSADTVSSATPLGLYSSETFIYSPLSSLFGNISGNWEQIYAIIPGAPGEIMPILSVLCGVFLYFFGVLDWRAPLTFIAAFCMACVFLDMPVLFNLFSGSLIFSAVFILTDLRTMPASKSGRLIAGFLAGLLNALIRHQGYYPEGIVIAVLCVNIISPLIDNAAFKLRSVVLERRKRAHQV